MPITPEVSAALVAARRVGAPLRACAAAAGVPWPTMCGWLRRGRAEGATGPCAALVAALDGADAGVDLDLRRTVLAAAASDPHLALAALRWRDGRARNAAEASYARARAALARAQARAATGPVEAPTAAADALDALTARLARLAADAG